MRNPNMQEMKNNQEIAFPVIILDKYYYMEIWQNIEKETKCSLYAYTKGFWESITLFDAKGMEWTVADATPTRRITTIERFLAPICYNPQIKVRLYFKNPVPYSLEKIKKAIKKILENDDDIYAQFSEKKDVIEAIDKADSFPKIVVGLKNAKAIGIHKREKQRRM